MKQTRISWMKFILFALVGGFITSCTKDSIEVEQPDFRDPEGELLSDYLTDMEASNQAIDLYSVLFSDELRGGAVPRVANIERVSPLRGLDGEASGGVIVVNFEDNKGYIVMSASKFN